MKPERCSGILLHITSLPGPHGVGTLGAEAHRFVDFLALAGQKLWQVLPLGPTGFGDSPYQCFSAFAGNPLLIGLDRFIEAGWLRPREVAALRRLPGTTTDFGSLIPLKQAALRRAAARFAAQATAGQRRAFRAFCRRNRRWLDDYALFMALKEHFGGKPWFRWPRAIRRAEPGAVREWTARLAGETMAHRFLQFAFFSQWDQLKACANAKGIRIIGDMPLYVAHDSADVWANPRAFGVSRDGRPTVVGGCPPDAGLRTGQLWGNPIHNWAYMRSERFAWWQRRVQANLRLYDVLRIDHFIGLVRYWAIPFGHKTAVRGRWRAAPGAELMAALERLVGKPLPFIAEDLGALTPEVLQLRDRHGLPGMKILQYAFGWDGRNEHLPHNFQPNCVVYTGTHDNDTMQGWFRHARPEERRFAMAYAGARADAIVWGAIRLAWESVAAMAVAPMQDLLALDSRARMNTFGTVGGTNWKWRCAERDLSQDLAARLKRLTTICAR